MTGATRRPPGRVRDPVRDLPAPGPGYPLAWQRPPLCPELRLALLDPGVDLDAPSRLAEHALPYWAFCWAGGQALARHLLDAPEWVRGRRVVDFGAGCGVSALAAALAGARRVVACDVDPRARRAAARNARANGARIAVAGDGRAVAEREPWDVLLVSDVCYEPGVGAWLAAHAEAFAGRSVLVGDPGRPGLPRAHLLPLARHPARTLPDVDEGPALCGVYALRSRRGAAGPPRRAA